MKQLLLKFILVLFSLSAFFQADATHLIGGTIGYDYLGSAGGNNHNYRIRLTTYQDCNSLNWWTVGGSFPVPTAEIGIYESTLIGGFIFRDQILSLSLTDSNLVRSGSTDSCFIPINNYCVYQVDYEAIVTLPATNVGYHFVYDVCCRGDAYPVGNGPNNISLFGQVGSIYHAWVGPTSYGNSSPIYDTLDPYLCISDTNQTPRLAKDPDGDSLFFFFITPYDGSGNSASSPPPNFINYPFTDTVNYVANHSRDKPLGPGSYASINPATGKGKYYGTTQGIYVLATQAAEFDTAGNIIGVSGFEFQYIVAPCQNLGPKNTADPNLIGNNLIYSVEEGDTICIDVEYFDPDSLQVLVGLESDSNIFSPLAFNPPAIVGAQMYDPATAISSRQVCWVTNCNMGRVNSYEFTSFAVDSGCPNRSADNIYEIKILPFEFPKGITGSSIACPNQSYTYQVDSIFGATYSWSITNGSIISGNGKHQITVEWLNSADSGSLTVNPISRFGCVANSKIKDVDITQMVPLNAGTDTIICGSDTLQLGGQPTGPSYYSYKWTNDIYLDDDSLLNPIAFPDTATMFTVTAYDTTGCIIRDSVYIDITINTLDVGPNLYVCPGDSVQIIAKGVTSYSWSPSSTLTAANVSNPIAFPLDTTYYALVGTLNNCTFFDTVRVDVDSVVPSYIPPQVKGCFGTPINIGGSPTGPKYTTFKWTPNLNITSDTAANPFSTTPTNTSYYLEVFNGACFGFDTVDVIVDSLPFVDAGNDTSVCGGFSITLNGKGDSLIQTIWNFDSGIFLDSISNPVLVVNQNEKLFFTGTNKNGCSNTDSIILNYKPLPLPNLPNDTLLCFGDTILFNIGGGSSFIWGPNIGLSDTSIANPKFFPSDTTQYILNVTGTNGCQNSDTTIINVTYLNTSISPNIFICPGDSTQLAATGGVNYSWDNGTKLNNDSISNPLAFPVNTTNFLVTISDAFGCQKIDSVLVEVSEGNFIIGLTNRILCYGDSTQLNAVGLTNPKWLPITGLNDANIVDPIATPFDSTYYAVSGIDSNGCKNQDSVFIAVLNKLDARAGNDVNICAGDSFQIGDNFIQGYVYAWEPQILLNNPLTPAPKGTVKTRTPFILTVTNQFNCSWQDTVLVNVFDIKAPDDTLICSKGSSQLTVTPFYGVEPYTYSWTPGSGLSDSTIGNPILTSAANITYRIIVEDSTGCADTTFTEIIKANKPTAEFETKYFPACEQMELRLVNTSVDVFNSFWVINSDTSFEESPYLQIPYSSPTNITLIVSAVEGCTDTVESEDVLKLFDDYVNVEISNVFTPNGDGMNDFFEFPVENKLMPCTEFEVYNRWGNLMFISQGNVHSWDGTTFDGQQVPDGIYFYTLKVNSKEWKGSVHLFR